MSIETAINDNYKQDPLKIEAEIKLEDPLKLEEHD